VRPRRPAVALVAVLLAFLALAALFLLSRRSAPAIAALRPDPVSPYLNARHGIKYVGDAACVRCHAEIAGTFRHHPMGRSLAPIAEASAPDGDTRAGRPLFERHGLEYSIENRDGRVFHQETRRDSKGRIVTRNEAEVQFTLGSGTRGVSYVIERDGFLFESPINWYSQKKRWDLSPGFEVANYHFDRPIRPGCLYCHANRFNPISGPINRYRPPIFEGHAIGCERCHGPGELHSARAPSTEGQDTTIVNPGLLEPSLRDAVCEQCHLIGEKRVVRFGRREEDFRPGLPFERFWTVLVHPEGQSHDQNRFVGEVEQMHASRCYRSSAGELGCISCHDPHKLPAAEEKVAFYRARCLACHSEHGCSLPASVRLGQKPADDCVGCHMPRVSSSDIIHAASTDHRIPRTKGGEGSVASPRPSGRPMVPFHRALMDARERNEIRRDIGVALCRDGVNAAGEALPLLEAALAVHPDDMPALEAQGLALGFRGRDDQALAAFRAVLEKEPERESALVGAAYQAVKMDLRQDAAKYWQRVIAVNPWRSDYRGELALVYFRDRAWRASADCCREALRLNPAWVEVRKWLMECYLHLGDREAARRELAIVLGFDPPDRDELFRLFSVGTAEK
jgi:predicted CXXCH cytochrome family protein